MNKSSGYIKNFLTILSGNTLSQLIPFLLIPYLTKVYSPKDFALLSNYMAIVTMIGIIAAGRLELAINLPKETQKAKKIFILGIKIVLIVTLLSCIIPFFSSEIGLWYNDQKLGTYLWMLPLCVFSIGLLGLTQNWALRQQDFKKIAIARVVQSLINNALPLLLAYWLFDALGLIIAWLISQFLNSGILLWKFKFGKIKEIEKEEKFASKELLIEYKDFPLINSFHAFLDIFATQFLLFWIISVYFGKTELGLFALMNKYVRAPIVLITSSVSQLFFVEASQALNEGKSILPLAKRTLRTTLIFGIPFILILLFFAPYLFSVYLGEQYRSAGEYAQCILPILFMYFILSPISQIPILMQKQRIAFAISILTYTLSLGALSLGSFLNWDFLLTLKIYSVIYAFTNAVTLIWYYSLIRSK